MAEKVVPEGSTRAPAPLPDEAAEEALFVSALNHKDV